MKAFVSWSGGKDCTFSLYKFLKSNNNINVECLLNMNRAQNRNAHRISGELLYAQAEATGFKLIRENIEEENNYTFHFHKIVNQLKEQGINYGIFGDIYLESHRVWLEEQCRNLNITPVFPIWGTDVGSIYKEFVDEGFIAKVISVRNCPEYKFLLGKNLSMELYDKMSVIKGFDVCGENGEYHTFVTDGPVFKNPVKYKITGRYDDSKINAIELDIDK